MKYASERSHYPIGFMCRVLEVSTSGFFAWQARARAPCSDADAPLREVIVQVHQESRRRYGRRRLTHALRARGWCVNPKRVRRVMREEGLRGMRKGRFVPRTTDSAHQRAIAPNVLQRRFAVDTAVQAWASDITYMIWEVEAALFYIVSRPASTSGTAPRRSGLLCRYRVARRLARMSR